MKFLDTYKMLDTELKRGIPAYNSFINIPFLEIYLPTSRQYNYIFFRDYLKLHPEMNVYFEKLIAPFIEYNWRNTISVENIFCGGMSGTIENAKGDRFLYISNKSCQKE